MESASEDLVTQIRRLEDEGPLDVAEVAARERRPVATVSGAVASLAEQGAVRRVAGEVGRACRTGPRLEVTDTGRSMLADDLRRHTEITARRIETVGTWAAVDVQRAADIVRDLLDAEAQHPETAPSVGIHKILM